MSILIKSAQALSRQELKSAKGGSPGLLPLPIGCGGFIVACPMNYAPVKCSNGQVYGNSCLAEADCQKNCQPVPFSEWD